MAEIIVPGTNQFEVEAPDGVEAYAKAGVAVGMTCGGILEIKAATMLAKSEVTGFWKWLGVTALCSSAADLFKQAASVFAKPAPVKEQQADEDTEETTEAEEETVEDTPENEE